MVINGFNGEFITFRYSRILSLIYPLSHNFITTISPTPLQSQFEYSALVPPHTANTLKAKSYVVCKVSNQPIHSVHLVFMYIAIRIALNDLYTTNLPLKIAYFIVNCRMKSSRYYLRLSDWFIHLNATTVLRTLLVYFQPKTTTCTVCVLYE